jgi:tetratricopeptide (TPR) repeat protein
MWMIAILAFFAPPPESLRSIEQLIAAGRYSEALSKLASEPSTFAAHLLASKAYDGMGDAARAVREAEAALALEPAAESAHLQLGQIFLSHNTPRAALEVFTEALALHPDSLFLRAGRGLALKELSLYPEAEKDLNICWKQRPGFPVCFDGLATIYLQTHRYEPLLDLAREQQRVNPSDYRGSYFAAAARNALDAPFAEVEKLLNESIERNPAFAASLALRGRVRLKAGHVNAAIADLESAIRFRPDYQPALLTLGQAYQKAGRESDAARAFALLKEANEKEREGRPALLFHRGPGRPNR